MKFILKDNLGREVGPYDDGRLDKDARSGLDMMIGIDLELQKYGEKLMKNKVGSIVFPIEPNTGEMATILPTFIFH